MEMDQVELITRFDYRVGPPMRTAFHSGPEYEVVYIHEGRIGYSLGTGSLSLEAGDLLLLAGLHERGAIAAPDARTVYSVLMFAPEETESLFSRVSLTDVLRPFRTLRSLRLRLGEAEAGEAENLLKRLDRFRRGGGAVGRSRLRAAFLDFLLFLAETCPSLKPAPSEKEKTVHQIIAYIEQNYMHDLTLEELESRLFVNKFYMMKIFKKLTGVTIFHYLNHCRINRAKVLFLTNRSISVTEAGFEVGFKHLSHFSRCFKQIVGLSPEQYRRLLSKNGSDRL